MCFLVYRGGGGWRCGLRGINELQGAVPSGNTVPPSPVAVSLELRRTTWIMFH